MHWSLTGIVLPAARLQSGQGEALSTREPDFIRTVSLSQAQAQFAELPETDARASSLACSFLRGGLCVHT